MNPLLASEQIQEFLDTFPSKSRRRGKHYFIDGAVIELACIEQDRKYAAVVRGNDDYDVTFRYDPTAGWSALCTCPMERDCKHAVAAMLALKSNGAQLSTIASSLGSKSNSKSKPKAPVVLRQEPKVPQPPASALTVALAQELGRKLDRAEVAYVDFIRHCYENARNGACITGQDLSRLSPQVQDYAWTPLTLWPKAPRDDHQFWLYCAWELRRRKAAIPQFMVPVTDLAAIEPAMNEWQRRKLIESWRADLAQTASESQPEGEPVDFRLMVLPDEVRVQWKMGFEEKFKDLKQTHVRRFHNEQENGALNVTPQADPIWNALYKPYDYYTACHFEYDSAETGKLLRRVLAFPDLAERIVSSDGLPLARPAEPLEYQLQPAKDESDDYELSLRLADGSPAPPVLLALSGQPSLYLTARALFQGPPPHQFGMLEPVRIPAPAMECAQGVAFIQSLQLDLPQRILERTRRVQAVVKLCCEVKPTYQGSQNEAVFIRVLSEVEGKHTEHCGSEGWHVPPNASMPRAKKQPAGSEEVIPLIDRSAQKRFPALLEALNAKWENYHGSWRIRLTKSFPETFLPWLSSLPPEVEVQLDRELATLRDNPVSGTLRLDVEEAGVDWFDLKVALNVSDMTLTPEELKLLLNARGGFVRLGKKGWRRLQFDLTPEEDERLARLGLNARDFTAEPQRLHALQLADEAARKFLPEQKAEEIHRRAAELKTRVTPPVPAAIHAELRPYQVEGFHFLSYLTANRFGGVLADDMGLGKTLQTLAWLSWLRSGGHQSAAAHNGNGGNGNGTNGNGSNTKESNGNGSNDEAKINGSCPLPSLVVCPKSVMDNWRAEAQRFCPGLRVRLWQGEEAAALESARAEADLIVLNYAQMRSLSPEIAQARWQAAILDEAQYIKNPDSQTAQIARTLRAEHRLALTGTPIENRLLDLWSIFAFSMPGVLGNRAQFTRRYNHQEDPLARRRLASRVRPFLLRRAKSQVAQDLPDRIEEDLICEMEGEQKTLYRAEFKRAQQMLLSIATQKELNEQRFHFLTSLLRLRQICCHPALVSEELAKAESAKVSALLDLLEPLMEEGHKVLVFSQFVSMLGILRQTVIERKWAHFYLAGETENRGQLVQEFQIAKGAAVFLISLKAGGFGLNLTAASYVVLFDPWWNPAVEMQAIDRTHRIGQTSKVMAYRLLIKDSIEQKIRQLQRAKAALVQDVLGEEKFAQSLTLDDLRFLFSDEPAAPESSRRPQNTLARLSPSFAPQPTL
ncbi:MAG TPA: DEAD/DEAH box helicase [Verrucomicrobiae bacterium]|nr:DEAD/DEAH box helicase [Verrucomicrobiae bacterium]